MSLGEKIQQLRKAKGFSQEQLADNLNVSRQAISKWETDQSSPDIEKILAISKVFSISTDELLENDVANNTAESRPQSNKMPKRLFNAVRRIKDSTDFIDSKIIFMLFTLSCFLAVGVCVIVNYAINGQITWAAYPIISVPSGWLIITPLLFRKYTIALCVLTVIINPFLYFMDKITPAPDWFCKLGLPSAIAGIVFFWVNYLLFRFIKISIWYKFAVSFFLGGTIVNPIINYFADRFSETEMSALNLFINIFSCLFVSALFWITGYIRNKIKSAGNKAEVSDTINKA